MTFSIAMVAGASVGGALLVPLVRRLQLSKAKHPSLRGHSKLSRRVARLLPFYEYDELQLFAVDDAPQDIVARRRAGFFQLADEFRERFGKSVALTREVQPGVSDLQFTSAYRVPFQFSSFVQKHLKVGAFLESSQGVCVTDLDGNQLLDLTGSYGVNVFGNDFYKACMKRAAQVAEPLGAVLGSYHPVLADNVARLRNISGQDEISFHMSGTEAVMQAVRLARYHTRRTHLVRFCGAYHGWWGDVQPGVGNPVAANQTYTLKDMSEDTLRVLRTRKDIACVLVNPLQGLHPNQNAHSDSTLLDSSRSAHFDREAYTAYLRELRKVCTERDIVLIFDEVFMGFRLAPGGAQEYFGVRADMVTYGKTLGGGLPIGVVCGRRDLMRRFREDRPADVCFARGTFNSHPYVMAAMNDFLRQLDTPAIESLYDGLDERFRTYAARFNQRFQQEQLPLRVAGMSSVWTVCYTLPSRYNWLLQYYLRSEGIALSWVGTGRLIFSLDFGPRELDEVLERFVRAARRMEQDGFFWSAPALTNKAIKRKLLRELLGTLFGGRR